MIMARLGKILKNPSTLAGAAILGPVGALAGGLLANKELNAAQATEDAQKAQQEGMAQFEKEKYQAIVDANFSQVARKRGMSSARSSQGLYGSMGTGLYG